MKKRYFFKDFADTPTCVIRVSGKAITLENGYGMIDPLWDEDHIKIYGGVEASQETEVDILNQKVEDFQKKKGGK